MSHFSVLVITKTTDEKELEKALQPFHEYECTGTKDQYVVFQDCHDEVVSDWENKTFSAYRSPDGKVYQGYEDIFYREPTTEEREFVGMGDGFGFGISWRSRDWGDGRGYRAKVHFTPTGFEEFQQPARERYETMEQFAEEYHGYDIIENGRIGRYTNPNKKWDWWVVGGRWSNFLSLKGGETANQAIKKDVDFVSKIKKAEAESAKEYDEIKAEINGRSFLSWKQCVEKKEKIDEARDLYNNQEVVKELREHRDRWHFDLDAFLIPRDTYIAKKGIESIRTFAVLKDGQWHQKGEMGWWAVVSDENEDWDRDFMNILHSTPEDAVLTVVDCHI